MIKKYVQSILSGERWAQSSTGKPILFLTKGGCWHVGKADERSLVVKSVPWGENEECKEYMSGQILAALEVDEYNCLMDIVLGRDERTRTHIHANTRTRIERTRTRVFFHPWF